MVENRKKIFGDLNITKSYPLKWPALEDKLVKHFEAARKKNKIVTVHWFRRISQQI
jgi:histidinol phosphatase-like PHP family hydrolase